MIQNLRARDEWKFAAILPRADRRLAIAWWMLLVLRGLLPAVFAIAMGWLVGTIEQRRRPDGPAGVGRRRVRAACRCCRPFTMPSGPISAAGLRPGFTTSSPPPASGRRAWGTSRIPQLTSDLTMARDFDLGISGPPLFISMDFIASGLVEMVGGLAAAVVLAGYAWWAPFLLAGAWLATHWLLRESAVWRDRNTEEVRDAQRHADYAYRLAVDPPAAKELRLFGLADWVVERFRLAPPSARRSSLAGHAAARAAGDLEPAARARRESSSCSGRWAPPRLTAVSRSAGW